MNFTRDMLKKYWTLESDTLIKDEVIFTSIELVPLLENGENYINGNTLLSRAATIGCLLGQQHAEILLKNQHLIPEEMRTYYLVFAGTIWCYRGLRFIPYLIWRKNAWYLHFYWLGGVFRVHCRLLYFHK